MISVLVCLDMKEVLYSIVIPTHARALEVKRALESALATAPGVNCEVIVVEDQTEGAKLELKDYIENGSVKYFRRFDGKKGASRSRNLGVEMASGKYILFLDDDDRLVPGYIPSLISLFLEGKACWGFGNQIFEGVVHRRPSRLPSISGYIKNGVFRNKVAPLSSGFWIRRDVFLTIGGLCPSLIIDEDTDLCCRLAKEGFPPYYLNLDAVVLGRFDGLKRLTSSTKSEVRASCYYLTFVRNFQECKRIYGVSSFLALRAHRALLRAGDFKSARILRANHFHLFLRLVLFLHICKHSIDNVVASIGSAHGALFCSSENKDLIQGEDPRGKK